MNAFRQLLRRLRRLARSRSDERAMDRELRDHIDQEVAEHVRRGLSPSAARQRALADFGSVDAVKDSARDQRLGRGAAETVRDLGYAIRVFRHNPGQTGLAILTFAVGIGMVSAIFSVVYGVLLRPLPYPEPDRLMAVWERNVPRNQDRNVVSIANYEAWRDGNHTFKGIAGLMPTTVTLMRGATPERIVGAEVTPGYFSLLGVPPALGRDFTPDDAHADNAMIVSDAFWRDRLGGDRSALGRSMLISGRPYTVIGIMPAGFDPPKFGWLGDQPVWFPMALTDARRSWGRFLLLVGRLEDGATLAAARSELEAISARRVNEQFNAGWSASVIPLATELVGDVRSSLLAVLVAVGLLLTMSVANVGTLTLTAMHRRSRELALRRALGATDGRLFRQLFTQSALLGVLGTAAGLAVAGTATKWLVALMPPEMPRLASIRLDMPVLAISASLAALTTIVFGAVAARRGRRASVLALTSRGDGDARATGRQSGGWLVGTEIALGIAVSVMALLMIRSVVHLGAVDLGFQSRGVIAARIAASNDEFPTAQAQRAFFARVLERFRAAPGVTAAGIISNRPFNGLGPADTVRDAAEPPGDTAPSPVADVRVISNDALAVLRVPVMSGTLFDPLTDVGAPPRVVINRTLAETLWPGQNAVGRKLAMNMYGGMTPEVIAVVGDVHLMDARTAPRATVYLSAARFTDTQRDILVRTDLDTDVAIAELRAALAEVAPELPLYKVEPLDALVSRSLGADRFTMALLGLFALVALVLAGIGVYGVFSSDVMARRREIGVRLALGGTATRIVLLLLARAMRRAAAGAAAGLLLAVLSARTMTSLLFGIEASDPVSLAAVAAGVVALAAIATLIPAWQALRASPLTALRQ